MMPTARCECQGDTAPGAPPTKGQYLGRPEVMLRRRKIVPDVTLKGNRLGMNEEPIGRLGSQLT